MSNFIQVQQQLRTESSRERAKKDLFFLAREVLGYNLMTPAFHGNVCNFLDSNQGERQVALFTPRDSYKTTLMVALVIQMFLNNPSEQVFYIHHKLEKSAELVREVGNHLIENEKLRAIFPAMHLPDPNDKQWLKTESFRLKGIKGLRHPSLSASSLGAELTGSHPTIVILDDIVNSKSVEEWGNPDAIRKWTEHTLTSILGAAGRTRLVGTAWGEDDFHADIMKPDSHWKTYIRAICEDEKGRPCMPEDGGKPIPILVDRFNPRPLSLDDVAFFRSNAKRFFRSQYMMIPDKAGNVLWDHEKCEHYVDLDTIRQYLKKVVIITDPAPIGSAEIGKDNEKDDWATCAIAYLQHKRRIVRVLVDGCCSKQWTTDAGLRQVVRLMDKWETKYVGIEEPLGAGRNAGLFGDRLKRLAQANMLYCKPLTLQGTQKGKTGRIADLIELAKIQDFMILEPDRETHKESYERYKRFLEVFLAQARSWAGKNSIPHDDCIDAVAYADDEAIREIVPKPMGLLSSDSVTTDTSGYRERQYRYVAY